jgi:hypothetical protein
VLDTHERTILVLNLELVLQHDEVDLTRPENELLLEQRAQGVEHVSTRSDLPVREETERTKLGDEDVGAVLERVELLELEDDAAGCIECFVRTASGQAKK